ncbi:hypothetical protein HMPREF9057_01038 [Actinomyces sp. oral taxon 171 str. F0337]|nr:hypothetical protein HMPREF9057_01038 [Actinomyces sp. oral taxon 171 str. F0337]
MSFRAGAFDVVGDRNPVTERARRPRLERNVPDRVRCHRRREDGRENGQEAGREAG